MAVVKLKQKDIEEIVSNIVNEQYWNEETKPEGELEENPMEDSENQKVVELGLFKDDDGNLYVIDQNNPSQPRVVAATKK